MDPLSAIIPVAPEVPVVTPAARTQRTDRDGRRRQGEPDPRHHAATGDPADDVEALTDGLYADLAADDPEDEGRPHIDVSA